MGVVSFCWTVWKNTADITTQTVPVPAVRGSHLTAWAQLQHPTSQRTRAIGSHVSPTPTSPWSQNGLCRRVCVFIFQSRSHQGSCTAFGGVSWVSKKTSSSFFLFFFFFHPFPQDFDFLKSPGQLSCKMSNFLDLSYCLLICVLSVDWKLSLRLGEIRLLLYSAGIFTINAVCHVASPPGVEGVRCPAVSEADFGHLAKIVTCSKGQFSFCNYHETHGVLPRHPVYVTFRSNLYPGYVGAACISLPKLSYENRRMMVSCRCCSLHSCKQELSSLTVHLSPSPSDPFSPSLPPTLPLPPPPVLPSSHSFLDFYLVNVL